MGALHFILLQNIFNLRSLELSSAQRVQADAQKKATPSEGVAGGETKKEVGHHLALEAKAAAVA